MHQGSKKVKFVVNGPLPSDCSFPSFRDFEVVHHYLQTTSRMMQSRLRKRGRKGKWSYTHTIRKQVCKDDSDEIRVSRTTTRVLYFVRLISFILKRQKEKGERANKKAGHTR